MKKTLPLLLLAVLLFGSCGPKVLLDEDCTFTNNQWMRFDEPTQFVFSSNNPDQFYNFVLTLVVDTARCPLSGIPITLQLCGPTGDTRTLFKDIVLRNYEGNWLGQCDQQGLLHVAQPIRQYYSFNAKGDYTVKISQRTHKYQLNGIHSLNLRIEQADIEYPK